MVPEVRFGTTGGVLGLPHLKPRCGAPQVPNTGFLSNALRKEQGQVCLVTCWAWREQRGWAEHDHWEDKAGRLGTGSQASLQGPCPVHAASSRLRHLPANTCATQAGLSVQLQFRLQSQCVWIREKFQQGREGPILSLIKNRLSQIQPGHTANSRDKHEASGVTCDAVASAPTRTPIS